MTTRCPHCKTSITVRLEFDVPRSLTDGGSRILADARRAAQFWGISYPQLVSQQKPPRLVRVRQILYAVLRSRGHSSTEIGKALQRDHSTVLQGAKVANKHNFAAILQTSRHLDG